MNQEEEIVISASRRTDIPAFYMDWFMAQVKRGCFEVANPFSHKVSKVSAVLDDVHTFVFWSKNFGPFVKGNYGGALERMGYHLFFNFTINSHVSNLEPRVPPVNERLSQLDYLCRCFDARTVNWRFDPVCFFKFNGKGIQNNMNDFNFIADRAAQCGVTRCITSFMDHYPKIQKRVASLPEFSFVDPSLEKKKDVLIEMEAALSEKNINLYTCCEQHVLEILPLNSKVKRASCIPNDVFVELFGGNLSYRKDKGQRVKQGCGCMISVDIGSYNRHPCYHNCLFCYANPSST